MTRAEQITKMVEILPVQDQEMILELTRKFVRAWDPDFTKLTPIEAAELKAAKEEVERGETISHEELMKELNM